MILPGLVSLAFYKRRPSTPFIILGLAFTIALSAILGYVSPGGPIGQTGSVIVAIVGGVILYFAILAYLWYRRQPNPRDPPVPTPPTESP
jgi:drug/metabolite transporter (DMT)-like permease